MFARVGIVTFGRLRIASQVLSPSLVAPALAVPAQNTIRLFHSSGGAKQGFEEFYDPVVTADTTISSGRAWTAPELRRKSFEDLQKLWYVLYKERNLLLTTKMRARRALNPPTPDDEARYMKVKRSMAAIKQVIGERRRIDALIKAQEAGQQAESTKTDKK